MNLGHTVAAIFDHAARVVKDKRRGSCFSGNGIRRNRDGPGLAALDVNDGNAVSDGLADRTRFIGNPQTGGNQGVSRGRTQNYGARREAYEAHK